MESAPGRPMIGLHVEKGVGPTAAPAFEGVPRGARLVMDDGWRWRAFMEGMAAGRVERDLRAAEEAAGDLPLLVTLRAAIQDVPKLEADEDGDRFEAELLWFRPTRGRLELLGPHQPNILASTLERLETLPSMAEKIQQVKDIDWRWMEILIGIPFERVSSGGLSPSEVWRLACAPWLEWVR